MPLPVGQQARLICSWHGSQQAREQPPRPATPCPARPACLGADGGGGAAAHPVARDRPAAGRRGDCQQVQHRWAGGGQQGRGGTAAGRAGCGNVVRSRAWAAAACACCALPSSSMPVMAAAGPRAARAACRPRGAQHHPCLSQPAGHHPGLRSSHVCPPAAAGGRRVERHGSHVRLQRQHRVVAGKWRSGGWEGGGASSGV